MLTPAQIEMLSACARVLHAPERIVVTGAGSTGVAGLLGGAAPAGVHVVDAPPDGVGLVDGPVDMLVIGPVAPYSAAVDTIERWSTRVVPAGSMFVLGAFAVPALTAALLRTAGSSPGWRYFGREGSVAEYTRADIRNGERLLNGVAQFAQVPGFARSALRRRLARRDAGFEAARTG